MLALELIGGRYDGSGRGIEAIDIAPRQQLTGVAGANGVGTEYGGRLALVAWEKICRPRKCGGLELRDFQSWNLAAIAKLVWWICDQKESLWVQWVHSVHLKQREWRTYAPGTNTSWTWRKICQVKDIMQPLMFQDNDEPRKLNYSLKMGYDWLMGEAEIYEWWPWMYNRWIKPKHRFIIWLTAHNSLLTGARLVRMNMTESGKCCVCDAALETGEHLFSECRFSKWIV